jgi:hypothetical protein
MYFWLVSDNWYIYLVYIYQIHVSFIRYKSKVHLPDRCINHQIQVKSTYTRYMYHSSDTSQKYIYQIDVSLYVLLTCIWWLIHLSGKCTFDLYLIIDTSIWYMYFWLVSDEWYIYLVNVNKSKVHIPDRCINHQIQVKSTYTRYMYHSSDTS